MNTEEILNMPSGREMDALIEKEIFSRTLCASNSASYIKEPNGYSDLRRNKKYSTDISAAFEVSNKLAKEPFAWSIESVNLKDGVFWSALLWGDMPDGSIGAFVSDDKCLPLAICRAALLAVVPAQQGGV